jgi:metal-sulfur cluster biosynthetic enzyme
VALAIKPAMPAMKAKALKIDHDTARELVSRVAASVTDPQTGLSAAELGFVQDVGLEGPRIAISVVPTHADCPSMNLLTMNLECAIEDAFALPHVRTLFSPRWDVSRLTGEGREKIRAAFARHRKEWRCVCGRPFSQFMKV